ncbi:spermine/spermidine synthase family protein [Saccharata proteae CBS 121410]|uniref:Spermine/spermidine synthase family protein n=1 Tax=Saccharata proteae CBS 121410 TaxID=1314787 RepID=A0A9P4LWX3_9PEZI|nr:spermine/spermidine synthase family protein [Saccharata proteae CBS 121410]
MSAKTKAPRKPNSSSPETPSATALLALAAASSTLSQLSLSPVYGSIPAAIWHPKAVTFIALAAVITRSPIHRFLPSSARGWIPVLAFWITPIQHLLFQYSSQLGATWGPVVTEFCTIFPFIYLSMFVASPLLDTLDFTSFGPVANLIPNISSYVTFSVVQRFVTAYLPPYMGTSQFITRSGLQILIAAASAVISPSKWLILAIPACLHTAFYNPHVPTSTGSLVLNRSLQETAQYTLLERHESLTGYVSVLESAENQFRVMRCDHSLLGGEWLVTPERRANGQTRPESIYTVFTMLEAVRLVKTASNVPDSEKDALVIGLGIGTSPSALIAHDINTTIVELDPAVYYMAKKYFNLPAEHNPVIGDAVDYVEGAATTQPGSYDYIIHDVFTGGAEPVSLFTAEFLTGLRTLLKADGVVAINYAGDLALDSTKLVLNTIFSVFPTCRIFRDQPPLPDAKSDFINMVVFCVPAGDGVKLTFRAPLEHDFLGSIVRQRNLAPRQELEVSFEPDETAVQEKRVLTKLNGWELERFQQEGAVSHWEIMRTVLPPKVWELW